MTSFLDIACIYAYKMTCGEYRKKYYPRDLDSDSNLLEGFIWVGKNSNGWSVAQKFLRKHIHVYGDFWCTREDYRNYLHSIDEGVPALLGESDEDV